MDVLNIHGVELRLESIYIRVHAYLRKLMACLQSIDFVRPPTI